jgi:DNA helicase-2/ATP-dependent DNA helicase PcrA
MDFLHNADCDFDAWSEVNPPVAANEQWNELCQLLRRLRKVPETDVPAQVFAARNFYMPILEDRYDNSQARVRDLEQLEQLAARFRNRAAMLAEITLDPPATAGDLAGEPLLDEDYLILSTIHSAKGLEWDAVYVIHAADGNIPSDMATSSPEQVEEELRLFYVALTRAKDWLYVCFPQRYFHYSRGPKADQHGFVQLTRFISTDVKREFVFVAGGSEVAVEGSLVRSATARSRMKAMWS